MKMSLRTILKHGIGSAAALFLMGSGQALAQDTAGTGAGALSAGPAAMTPAQLSAAIARAQGKMLRAQAIANQYAHRALIEGFQNDSWRVELMSNLLQGTDEGFDRAQAAGTLAKALQAAQQSMSDRRQSSGIASNKALGSATADLTFIPMATPCRIVDTRTIGGAFGSGEVRTYTFRGGAAQGGVVGCDPYLVYPQLNFPAAMAINVGAIAFGLGGSPAVSGFVSVFPQGGSGSTAFLNFWGNDIISNAGVAGLNQANGQFSVLAQFPTHITVDYFGSFVTPQRTALDCNVQTVNGNPGVFVNRPACGSGFTGVATYCSSSSAANTVVTCNELGGFWNGSGGAGSVDVRTECCRTPGN